MQTVSSSFTTKTAQRLRKIDARVLISFLKDYDPAVDFFTIGVSTIGSTDILKGDSTVLQEWDKYSYDDFSSRILSIEVDREADPPLNQISIARASIVLDNTDDIFTPGNASSPYDGYLIPKRPVRINVGFGADTVSRFVGITEAAPEIDEVAKTARFRCVDFLGSILNQPLDEDTILVSQRSDEAVQAILEGAGLSATQFDLDTGSVIIPFVYFKKGMKRGDALTEIAEAELGNISMSEAGRIRFQARQNWNSNTNVWTFDESNTYERRSFANNSVINVVEVYANARAVQDNQLVWQANSPVAFSDGTTSLKPGETKFVFADFQDDDGELPVTAVDTPVAIVSAVTSSFEANTLEDGTGTDISTDISVDSVDLFSTSVKLTFTNGGASEAFFLSIRIFGTPARVVSRIYERVADSASIGTFDGQDEQRYKIENNLIQDSTAANTIGQIVVDDRATDNDQQVLVVKAVPQLQIGDVITFETRDVSEQYFVTRINDIISTQSGYRQTLQVSKRTINTYFRIGISAIGGADVLGP